MLDNFTPTISVFIFYTDIGIQMTNPELDTGQIIHNCLHPYIGQLI